MSYQYLDHTADVMFSAEEKTLEDLFTTCASVLFETLANVSTVKDKVLRKIDLTADSVQDLLYAFLEEIVFLKDADALVFCRVDQLTITGEGPYTLTCALRGDVIGDQELRSDVKAVTLHEFVVEQRGDVWFAQVILDI